jgi:hypothetical protein
VPGPGDRADRIADPSPSAAAIGGYTGSQEILSMVVDDMTRRVLSEQDGEPASAQNRRIIGA